MKTVFLALNMAFFATLINLASTGSDAGIKVVASYQGYDKRQFSKKPILLCSSMTFMDNAGAAERTIQSFVNQQASRGTVIPLGTPTIIFANVKADGGTYCKFVRDDYKGPLSRQHIRSYYVTVEQHPMLAFYAKKVADQRSETVYAAGSEMLKVMAAVKDPKQAVLAGSVMVEITANNEIYVGPIDLMSYNTRG